MVFPCRVVIFSELFYYQRQEEQQQQIQGSWRGSSSSSRRSSSCFGAGRCFWHTSVSSSSTHLATVSPFSTMPRKKFPWAPTAATQQAAAKMCFQPLQVTATVLKQLRHNWCQPCQPSLNPTRFLSAGRYTRLSTHSMLMPTHHPPRTTAKSIGSKWITFCFCHTRFPHTRYFPLRTPDADKF